MSIRLALLLLVLVGPLRDQAAAQERDPLTAPYPDSLCTYCAAWSEYQEPFRIHGDSYYVGTRGLSAILIASPDGHVLIDGALPNLAPQILDNIVALGFTPADVALILNSHPHFDHAGGIAALRRATGARVAASPASAVVLEQGRSGPDDPSFGILLDMPAVPGVERFAPGDTLRVGSLALASHATAGHTPGGTSWSWRSCDADGCLDLVYADSQTPVSADGFRFTDSATYPSALADFERGLDVLERLSCDILITTHPGASALWERLAGGPAGLVDPGACRRYADAAREGVAERIARETADR